MPKELIKTSFGTYGFEQSGLEITGFLNSENTIETYVPSIESTQAIPKHYGFEVIDTGGGCTAWFQKFMLDGKPVHMLITDDGGMTHKAEPGDRIIVGVYHSDQGGQDEIVVWEQANFPLSAESNVPVILVPADQVNLSPDQAR